MNLDKKTEVMLVMGLLLFMVPVGSTHEFSITTQRSNQYHPKVYGDYVVWHDYRNGDWNIYGYDLEKKEEFQITTDTSDQFFPAIYGNTIVWYDMGKGDSCYIYRHDLSKNKEEILIREVEIRAEEVYSGSEPLEPYPAIYGNIVVWQDYRYGNWDIYGYDLSKRQEFPIAVRSGDQFRPAIYGNIVVWGDQRDGDWDIYQYNISTRQIFQVESNDEDQRRPAIYGNIVVWEDHRHGNWDIYACDLSTNQVFSITTDSSDQFRPAIYGDIVVWEDNRNGNVDIYGYNLSMNQEFQIITHESTQYRPAIYGNIVVWFDRRNENSDIYGCDISKIDNDGDGYSPLGDCDNNDPRVRPGETEICDGKDNDCDKKVDEGFDKDKDGYTKCEGDCNDSDSSVYPGAQESCGKDYNCDGHMEPCKGDLGISVVDSKGRGLKAQIYVDGVYRGETNSAGTLPISGLEAEREYIIRVEAEKYSPEESMVKIEKNMTLPLTIQMKKNINLIYLLGGLLFSSLFLAILILKLKSRSKKKNPKSASPKPKSTRIYCPRCRNNIEKTWVSCPHCGADLRDDTRIYDEDTRIY